MEYISSYLPLLLTTLPGVLNPGQTSTPPEPLPYELNTVSPSSENGNANTPARRSSTRSQTISANRARDQLQDNGRPSHQTPALQRDVLLSTDWNPGGTTKHSSQLLSIHLQVDDGHSVGGAPSEQTVIELENLTPPTPCPVRESRTHLKPSHRPSVETIQTNTGSTSTQHPSTLPGPTLQNGRQDKDNGLGHQWSQWSKYQESQPFWTGEHCCIANGHAIFYWDGVIPRRTTRGLPLKPGAPLEICNIVNSSWYQVHHKNKCMYVPSAFVRVDGYKNDDYQALFEQYPSLNLNTHISQPSIRSIALSLKTVPTFLVQLFRFCCNRSHGNRSALDLETGQHRPDVPPAPFDREPHETWRKRNRILVSIRCMPLQEQNALLILLDMTLLPAPRWRFTTLSFSVELPPEQVIAGVYPQEKVDGSTNVLYTAAHNNELAVGASAARMGANVTANYTRGTAREVAFVRKTKNIIVGGGVNSSKALWNASEDPSGRSGLDSRQQFSIIVSATCPPPTIGCYYETELGRQNNDGTKDQNEDRFSDRWDFGFTADPDSGA